MAPHAACRTGRALLASALCAVAVATAVGLGPTGAHAEPSAADLEKQIDQAWNELEPVIEKHNATRLQLAARRKQADALAVKIKPLQLQIDLALNRVGVLAAQSYKSGTPSVLDSLLAVGTADTLTQRLESLDQFARRQQHDVEAVVRAKQAFERQKRPLDALVTQLAHTEAQLAARKKQIDADLKRLDALRLAAYGTTGGTGELRPAPCPVSYPGGAAGKAVRFACSQIGKPYVWGAEGPGSYDCSGLTMRAWAQGGASLPHNAAAQRRAIKSVSRSALRPGDLVFFYADLHHVGMYVGGGWMVHAPSSGDRVRMRKIDTQPIHSYGRPA